MTSIEVGLRAGNRALVRQGLQPGDEVIVFPPEDLRDGDPVRVEER